MARTSSDPNPQRTPADLGLALPDLAPGEVVDIAVAYVRVSSHGQLGRDGDEGGDGYSIPAQVQQSEREARDLGLHLAKVYVERAASAKTDDRPVLQWMMSELPAIKRLPMVNLQYLIVPKVDRLARNRLDDALLCQKLISWGINLTSATEHIDATPSGKMMHGMLAVMSEYFSNNLATEVMKGLRRKHEMGGTPHKPPIGYLSRRELIGGKDIRSVIVDPVRAPFVERAFTLYATGEWTLQKLTDHLEREGLRSRGTPKYPERPLSRSRIHDMLRNPYYKGIVTWNGQRRPGKHEPLVDPDTFDRVQGLLAAARIGGDRAQKHEHYLRGTVYCDECLGRLIFGRHRSRSGQHYEYFSCNNRTVRRRGQCSSGHYSVPVTEDNIMEVVWPTVFISAEVREQIRAELRRELAERTSVIETEAKRHERAIKQIEAKQQKLIQLFYNDRISEDVFAVEQDKLKAERAAAAQLRDLAAAQLEDVEAALELALSRVEHPYEAYKVASLLERRLMNRAIFERIEVGPEAEVTGTKLTPVYEALSAWQPGLGRPKTCRRAQDQGKTADVRPLFVRVHVSPEGRTENPLVRLSSPSTFPVGNKPVRVWLVALHVMPERDEIALAAVEVFCEARVPEQYRDEVRLECTRRGNAITIFERRAPWNPDLPDWTSLKVAQLRFDPASRRWSLYCRDSNERWWPYEDVKPSASIDVLLAEIDADPTGIFWG